MDYTSMNASTLTTMFLEDQSLQVTVAEAIKGLSARDQIKQKYGEPSPAYYNAHCTTWEVKKEFAWFPAEKIFINKDFRDKLRIAFRNIQQRNLMREIKTYNGCHAVRKSRGLKVLSLHAWAMAIDLNAAENPLGGQVKFSQQLLQCFRDAGLYCGADWKRKDGMHFALYNG